MKNKPEKMVWIDIDDTIAMSWPVMVGCGIHFCEEKGMNAQPNFDIECEDDLYFADILHIQEKHLADFFCENYPDYLTRIEPAYGAKEFLQNLKQHGYQINLISARRDKDGRAEYITRTWLEENNLPYDMLIINCKDKASWLHNRTGFFIDDSYGHCIAVSQGTSLHVIQKRCPFSKECPGVFHGYTWNEILEHILEAEM